MKNFFYKYSKNYHIRRNRRIIENFKKKTTKIKLKFCLALFVFIFNFYSILFGFFSLKSNLISFVILVFKEKKRYAKTLFNI
jgi:hypothetical protein